MTREGEGGGERTVEREVTGSKGREKGEGKMGKEDKVRKREGEKMRG